MKRCGFKSISHPCIYDGQVTFAACTTIPSFKIVPGKWYNYRQAMNSGEPVWDVVKTSNHIQVMVHPRLGEFPYQGIIIAKLFRKPKLMFERRHINYKMLTNEC